MKKILMSLLTIAIVGALITGGAIAMFSDVEQSTGTFTAGTIDIAVGDNNDNNNQGGMDFENPWSEEFTITLDGKPSQKWFIDFVIKNVGTNPCVVWKHLDNFVTGDGDPMWPVDNPLCSSEPEFVACGGEFRAADGTPIRWKYDPVNDIDTCIDYDLWVVVYGSEDMVEPMWWQCLYDQNITMHELECQWIILGSIPVGGVMVVTQSYHLNYANTTNEYQGDTLTFDIVLHAEQMEGTTLLLQNKTPAEGPWGEWRVEWGEPYAELDFSTVGSTFDYTATFDAYGLTPFEEYALIYYADPWPNLNGVVIGVYTADANGDILGATGNPELNTDIPNPLDQNASIGGKIWLIFAADLVDADPQPGDSAQMVGWNGDDYLYETHLLWYNDTDVP